MRCADTVSEFNMKPVWTIDLDLDHKHKKTRVQTSLGKNVVYRTGSDWIGANTLANIIPVLWHDQHRFDRFDRRLFKTRTSGYIHLKSGKLKKISIISILGYTFRHFFVGSLISPRSPCKLIKLANKIIKYTLNSLSGP